MALTDFEEWLCPLASLPSALLVDGMGSNPYGIGIKWWPTHAGIYWYNSLLQCIWQAHEVITSAGFIVFGQIFITFVAFLHFWRKFWIYEGQWGHKFDLLRAYIISLTEKTSIKKCLLVKTLFTFTKKSLFWLTHSMG